MPIVVLAQGKLKDKGLSALVDDYLARIRRYTRVEQVELKSTHGFARAVPSGALLVALEVTGKSVSSPELSKKLEGWMSLGKGVGAFAIGGAEGLRESLVKKAAFQLCLSPLTLPHRLARLLLVEQLYRAFTILRGEPYARED
jgi:23S rRNA (pseudouridine1915-N3)-methyltransferase